MSVTAEALRELHRIHRQLSDVRERLSKGPKQIKAANANMTRLSDEHAQAKDAVMQARKAADEKQLQLKTNEDRIENLKGKRNACASNREYQALVEQIAADEMANSVLSDEILELLEKVDELQVKVGETEAASKKAEEEIAKLKQRVDGERDTLENEMARLGNDLAKAEALLPVDLKADYDRVVGNRGEEALAPLDGEYCGSCFQIVTPQMINELTMAKPVFCKSCGCLLYLPE